MTGRATRRGLLTGGAGLAAHNLSGAQVSVAAPNALPTGVSAPHPDTALVQREALRISVNLQSLGAAVAEDAASYRPDLWSWKQLYLVRKMMADDLRAIDRLLGIKPEVAPRPDTEPHA